MKKILITGGTGFVGHWLQQAIPSRYEVVCLDRVGYSLGFYENEPWAFIFHLGVF